MPDFLIFLTLGLLFVLLAVGLVLGSYFAARMLLHPGAEGDRTHEAASTIAVRIAALHGLILALVYAQELDNYKGVQSGLIEEGVAISDVFNDMRRYEGPDVQAVQQGLAIYVKTVVSEEWDSLGRGDGLSAKAWAEWESVYNKLLDLAPATNRQTYLAGRMRDRITAIAKQRQMREAAASRSYSTLFWAPALVGLGLLAAPLYVYRPSRTHLALFAMFGLYSAVILFFIYSFANPFASPGKLDPAPFEGLLAGDLGKALNPQP